VSFFDTRCHGPWTRIVCAELSSYALSLSLCGVPAVQRCPSVGVAMDSDAGNCSEETENSFRNVGTRNLCCSIRLTGPSTSKPGPEYAQHSRLKAGFPIRSNQNAVTLFATRRLCIAQDKIRSSCLSVPLSVFIVCVNAAELITQPTLEC